MKRVSRLAELRALSNDEFDNLMKINKNQKDVAEQFGVSPSMVSKEVSKRMVNVMMGVVDMRNEFQIHSQGAWKKSKERYSFVEAGLMGNKSIKFN